MSTLTHTPAPTATNPGMLAMRRTLAGLAMCKALGLAPRETPPARAEAAPKAARKPAKPAPAQASADEPEQMRSWRVCVLVATATGITHVNVAVDAPGPRRAARMARASALQSGHSPVGTCATATEDAPAAVWAALAPA